MIQIKMTPGWEKKVENAVKDGLNDALQAAAQNAQKELDKVYRQYSGKPVATVKPAVRRALNKAGATPSASQLTKIAQVISDGDRPVLRD